MRPISLILLQAMFGLCLISETSAQHEYKGFNEEWRWTRFTKESGLPSEHVYNLTETNDGTVWVSTTSGIAYYDGFQWRRVGGTLTLPVGRFNTFVPMNSSQIAVTIAGDCFIGDRNGFRHLSPMKIVEAVPFGTDSLLLLSSAGQLLIYARGVITRFDSVQTLRVGEVYDIWQTANGYSWIATSSALYQWENGAWVTKLRAKTPWLRVCNRILLQNNRGKVVTVVDQPLEMWGLWEWKKDLPIRTYAGKSQVRWAALNDNDNLLVIFESGRKRIWIDGKWSDFDLSNLITRDIEFIQYRRNGDIWFGTQHGLYLYRPSSPLWTYVHDKSSDYDYKKSINEIVVARDSALWLATSYGVEVHYPDSSVKIITEINGKLLYMVTGMAEDPDGNIWISSGGSFDGAYEWNGKKWKWYGDGTALASKRIHKIKQDLHGRLWFLSIWPRDWLIDSTNLLGADVLDKGRFVEHFGKKEGLASNQVYSFAEGADGTMWFGTLKGLSRYKNGVWKHWINELSSYPLGRVFSIAVDKENRVWLTNRRNGLWYVDATDSLQVITTEDGLINNEVWDVNVDSLNRVWVTTGGGLSCYDHGIWTSVDSKTGLMDSELWPVVPIGEKVYIGSRGGVSILNLAAAHYPNPHVTIEKPVIQEHAVLLRWRPLAFWGTTESDDILTRFRVNGNPWSKWTKTHGATIEDLDAGEHVVEVQALGLFSEIDNRAESTRFSIKQKFYEDSFFLFPLGGFAFLILWLSATAIRRKKNYDKEIHESEAKFRTITETTSSAIFIYDSNKVLFANASAEQLTGYSHEEFLDMSILDILHPETDKVFKEVSLAFSPIPGPNRIETRIQTKTGRIRWVDYMEGRIEFHGIEAVVGTAFDITQRKSAEGEIIASHNQLRKLASELAFTEERERRRMAVFLHDAIGQTLALCKLKVGTLQHALKVPEIEKPLQEIRGFLDHAIRNTRSLTAELSPPILHELGLVAAIEWIAEKMQEQSSIKFRCEDDGELKPLSDELSAFLFQAVRELLMNAVKHSKAKQVVIHTERKAETICITVADDGIGGGLTQQSVRGESFGLFNIRERLNHFGGTINISPAQGAGTQIVLICPLGDSIGKD